MQACLQALFSLQEAQHPVLLQGTMSHNTLGAPHEKLWAICQYVTAGKLKTFISFPT